MHPKAKAEPVLLAWGIDTCGKPVLLGLTPGASEPAEAWIAFLTELNERGMSAPLLVISDGGKGLAVAIERFVSASVHQRCTIHVARNVLAKVPKHAQGELKGDHWAIFDKLEGSGDEALAEGRRRARRFIAKCKPLYPAAAACVEDNLAALLAYLDSPRRAPQAHPALQPARAHPREDETSGEGDHPPPRRAELPLSSGPSSTGHPRVGAASR